MRRWSYHRLGGDTFDYALAYDTVHLGVFDAMGHDTTAGLTSSLAVAAFRNHRLQGPICSAPGRGSRTCWPSRTAADAS